MLYLKKYPLSFFFLFVIFFIPILGILDNNKNFNNEKRTRHSFPSLKNNSISSYILQMDQYTEDNFGLRDDLLTLHDTIQWDIFQKSTNQKVVRGKDNWLFLRDSVNLYEGKKNSSKIKKFLYLQEFCKKIDIPIYVVVIPNKSFAKEDYLPDFVKRANQREIILKQLKQINSVEVLDLYDLFLKQEVEMWRKYDTHWNAWGAYLAYTEIIDFLNFRHNNVFIVQLIKSTINTATSNRDLAFMIKKEEHLNENSQQIILTGSSDKKVVDSYYSIYYNENGNRSVLLIHDSFGEHYLADYLSHTFQTTHAIQNFNFKYIEAQIHKINYDFVIIEIVDRHLSLF